MANEVDMQRAKHDEVYRTGPRGHVTSTEPLVRYLTRWRLETAMATLVDAVGDRLNKASSILVMCAGEGLEGTVLSDLGYTNVTVSDISPEGVKAALTRDNRLNGFVLNAENASLDDAAYDIVIVQDGLHHLPRPVTGFTEMLRIASVGVLFLEPHDALSGNLMGTAWERNGDAVNYVFRWKKKLVEDVANSLLGPNSFTNLSFSFWHHNLVLDKVGRLIGGGKPAIFIIDRVKRVMDAAFGRFGNQFCGLVVKNKAYR